MDTVLCPDVVVSSRVKEQIPTEPSVVADLETLSLRLKSSPSLIGCKAVIPLEVELV